MASVYPTHPIIARDELMQCIDQMKVDKAAAAFVYAGAAATLHCTDEGEDKMATLRNLVTHAIELMGNALPLDNVSVLKATSCFFIANCLVAIQDANTAFLYLRQGVTMIEIMWSNSQMSTEPRLRRLYWLAYVHERYQCFSEDRRPILRPLSAVGLEDNDVAPEILIGLARVVKLFQLIDETFVRCWLNSSHEEAHFTTEWIEAKCDAFEKDEREANSACLTITQEADLFITRHWLLALLWRMSMARGLLRDLSPEKCFSMLFPLHVSKHLRQMMERIPKEAFQIHGVGIVQKLFELTDTVADVMLHVPSAALEQLEDYLYLQNVLFGFPHLDAIRRRIVSDKSARILRNAGSSPYLVDAAS
ncbi:hypothetical protein PRZ48_006672 [Zasmidium cellare]|uniref:Transcription factor domain-containing protein n=1 Tax=Zasmidium cellare TaxID=395010 RepID=A0ABR0ENR7_ZASCE|nr:hypothetical protein PRZ48_006672 [Zasmidium cellare]